MELVEIFVISKFWKKAALASSLLFLFIHFCPTRGAERGFPIIFAPAPRAPAAQRPNAKPVGVSDGGNIQRLGAVGCDDGEVLDGSVLAGDAITVCWVARFI